MDFKHIFKVSDLSFKIEYNKLKDMFLLKVPYKNNIEFKTYADVIKFVRSKYPRFVVNKFYSLRGLVNGKNG